MAGRTLAIFTLFLFPAAFLKTNAEQEQEQEQGHRPLRQVRGAQEQEQEPGAGAGAGQEQETMRQDPGEWRSYPPVLSRVDPRGG